MLLRYSAEVKENSDDAKNEIIASLRYSDMTMNLVFFALIW